VLASLPVISCSCHSMGWRSIKCVPAAFCTADLQRERRHRGSWADSEGWMQLHTIVTIHMEARGDNYCSPIEAETDSPRLKCRHTPLPSFPPGL
jgi:hypothetical protein